MPKSNITTQQVRESLIQQLKNKHADIDIYIARIDDYCFFHQELQRMKQDIREKGYTYIAMGSQVKEYEKTNDSVVNALKYSQEMTKILANLKLNTENVIRESGSDEDDEDL